MKKYKTILIVFFMIIVLFIMTIPILNMIGTSLKTEAEILTNNNLFSTNITFEHYIDVFQKTPFLSYMYNSFVIAVSVTLLCTIVSALAGYAISRYKSRIRFFKIYLDLLLVLQMFPVILMLIPLFMLFKFYGLSSTRISAILIYGTFALPFSIWMLSGFFDGIPNELEEAGVIDGCSQFQCFIRLILPISSPGIASVAIFTFLNCWNEYLLASIFLKREEIRTLQLGLQNFIQQFHIDWGSLTAAATITIIPAVFFLIFLQKYIVRGLTSGAVKG